MRGPKRLTMGWILPDEVTNGRGSPSNEERIMARGGGVAVGQRQPFAGAESVCDDTHTLRRMSAQLELEAELWAAVLRSCPDTQPWAQMPTLAPELLCHPFNLTGGHRLHSQMPPKGCGPTGQEAPLCRGKLALTRISTHSYCPLPSRGLITPPPWLQEELVVQGPGARLRWALVTVTVPHDRVDALWVSAAMSQFFLSRLSNPTSVSQEWDRGTKNDEEGGCGSSLAMRTGRRAVRGSVLGLRSPRDKEMLTPLCLPERIRTFALSVVLLL